MTRLICLSILVSIKIIDCLYLEAESNYLKPKLERSNVVNKGVWIRNKLKETDLLEKGIGFIFRQNSLDADNDMQNTFDAFNENNLKDPPTVSNYVQRSKRSPHHIRRRRPRKSMKLPQLVENSIEDSVIIKTKITTDLQPAPIFKDIPNRLAISLDNEHQIPENITLKRENVSENLITSKHDDTIDNNKNSTKGDKLFTIMPLQAVETVPSIISKRNKKYNNEAENTRHYNTIDDQNVIESTTYSDKIARDVFEKEEVIWNQNAPLPVSHVYKVVPKEPEKSKSITEKGLVKVIAMLTKTFKKITKQHIEIKGIHDKLANVSNELDHKMAEVKTQFQDFNAKYTDMIQFNNRLKDFETELRSQKDNLELKQKEIRNTFLDFQNQQKKFLAQQKHFFTLQKLMLAQNEKINAKQSSITKSQNEISQRQNNFARILKKAKQIISDNKPKLAENKETLDKDKLDNQVVVTSTTPMSPNTHAMKINLLSISPKQKLVNQDASIIKEKDNKEIDDLVYKYYFNNTFIDNLMKTKILNNYVAERNGVELVNRSAKLKNKRNFDSTLMIPIQNKPLKRERRWINRFSSHRNRKNHKHRSEKEPLKRHTDPILGHEKNNKLNIDEPIFTVKNLKNENDPFKTMATNFCNGIGQNTGEQALKWCVEKTLRRLKYMQRNAFTPPPPVTVMQPVSKTNQAELKSSERNTINVPNGIYSLPTTKLVKTLDSVTTLIPGVTPMYTVAKRTVPASFFPDNDELELKLKEYDSKPDTEGTVYYEGSVHISDFGRILHPDQATNSEDASDFMPGLGDSNSKFEIDPLAFDLQAKRRAYVERLNESLLKGLKKPE